MFKAQQKVTLTKNNILTVKEEAKTIVGQQLDAFMNTAFFKFAHWSNRHYSKRVKKKHVFCKIPLTVIFFSLEDID